MNTKLYVGNLPYETTESDLQTLFEAAGQVSTITIVRDRATGQARGFAFVEMSDAEGARRAIAEIDQHQVGGRSLTVNEAKPMPARSGVAAGSAAAAAAVSGASPAGSDRLLLQDAAPGSVAIRAFLPESPIPSDRSIRPPSGTLLRRIATRHST